MSKIHITIEEELKKKIKEVAEKKERSINFVVNEAIARYVKRFKK